MGVNLRGDGGHGPPYGKERGRDCFAYRSQ
jgi:hypothetical protein